MNAKYISKLHSLRLLMVNYKLKTGSVQLRPTPPNCPSVKYTCLSLYQKPAFNIFAYSFAQQCQLCNCHFILLIFFLCTLTIRPISVSIHSAGYPLSKYYLEHLMSPSCMKFHHILLIRYGCHLYFDSFQSSNLTALDPVRFK